MITIFLIQVVIAVFGFVFFLLPSAHLVDIPVIGVAVSDLLVSIMSTWNAFMITFPYAHDSWIVFIYVIIPFELSVIVIKFFLGSRSPIN